MPKKKKVKAKKKVLKKKKVAVKRKPAKKSKVKKAKKKVQAQPKGYNTITPYLIVNDANAAIDFYKKIFSAKEVLRMEHNGGKIGHAELKIGDTKIMLADEHPEMDARGPQAFGGTPVSIHLYVKDVDTVFDQAISAGANAKRAPETMFYGDRSGTVEDPFGHRWHLSTHVEDVSPRETKKRAEAMFGKS